MLTVAQALTLIEKADERGTITCSLSSRRERLVREDWHRVPVVPALYERIYAAITEQESGYRLDMSNYHATENKLPTSAVWHDESVIRDCGTAHCMAGFATLLSGPEGLRLERRWENVELAAAAIFLKSTGTLPRFHVCNDEALRELEARLFDQEELT